MRSIQMQLISFLAIAILFSIAGCDAGAYSAEKRFWNASREFDRLMRNVERARPEDYQKVIDAFRDITVRYPTWENSARAQFNIGQIYAIQNNFPQARAEFGVILEEYPVNVDICATALFATATIYEREDSWDKAKETLDKLIADYPNTYSALQAPLYIAQYYKRKAAVAEAEAAYEAALEKYKQIIKDNPKTFGAVLTVDFVVSCYGDRDMWNEAIDYLNGLAGDYADSPLAPKALFAIGLIYQNQLEEPKAALDYYRKLIDRYADNFLVKPAEKQIELITGSK